MRKYLVVFGNSFYSTIEYRFDLLGQVIINFISLSSTLIIIFSLYKGYLTVAGFTLKDTASYYLLVPLVGFFTIVNISDELGESIKKGSFSNFLLKPISIKTFYISRSLGIKTNFLIIIIPVYFFLLRYSATLGILHFQLANILLGILLASLGFFFHFILDTTLSWSAFWFDDIWSIKHFKNILFTTLGGLSFPFEFAPHRFRQLLEWLPFKYFYYVPVSYLNSSRNISNNLPGDLLELSIWSLMFFLLGKLLYKRGLKKYCAYGY